MFNRMIIVLTAAACAACLLTSCGDGSKNTSSSTRSSVSGEERSREESRITQPDITSRTVSDPTVSGIYSGEEIPDITVSQ